MKRKALTRITKVRFTNNERTIFGGILLKDAINLKSAKVIVQVDIPTQSLPVEAAVGQVWEISGPCDEEIIENNGYKIRQAVWRNPISCELKMPATYESLIQFLAFDPDFRGIGSVKARKLVQAMGNDIVRLATIGDREAFRNHLTDDSIDALIEGFQKYKNLRHAQFLSNHGIPLSVQRRLFKAHGESAVDQIKCNPYSLLTFGLTFEQTEKIATSQFGLSKNDDRRFAAATEQALIKHCGRGHTCATSSDLKRRVGKILSTSNDGVIAHALESGKNAKFITYDSKSGRYHSTALLIMERVVAKRLRKIGSAKSDLSDKEHDLITESAMALPFPITERQSDAVEMSLSHGLSCVIGGAGTGKTTVLRTTIECYRALDYNIYAMALSGRAATRLRESIGIKTMTIARFLRNVEVDDKPTLLVIDEASMLDLPTLYQIIIKTTASIRLLLVGDPDQLPPIGAGLPLRDIISSRVCPVVELDIVQRQDEKTGIPAYSLTIRNGELPPEMTVGRIHFHEVSSREEIIVHIPPYRDRPFRLNVTAYSG
jgi:exodeoxyribonuclease V alpha subunit